MVKSFISNKVLRLTFRILIFSMLACSFTVLSYAFNVTYSGVHYRYYTDSTSNHVRVFFGIENDGSITPESISWTVTSPDFEVETYSPSGDCQTYSITGSYDELQGFQFSPITLDDCYMRSKISNDPGTDASYTLTITQQDGEGEPQEVIIDNLVLNPKRDPATGEPLVPSIVDINTLEFSIQTINEEDVLRMDWELPSGMGDNILQLNLVGNPNSSQAINLTLPNTMTYALIPFSIIQQFQGMNSATISFRTQTTDGKVRSYSDSVTVNFADIIAPGLEPSVLASYPFSGTGFFSFNDNVLNQHATRSSEIQGTISLVGKEVQFAETCWIVDTSIGNGAMSFTLKDSNSGTCYSPYIDSTLIYLSSSSCWGNACPEDPTRPGATGSQSLNMFINLSDLTGVMALQGYNQDSTINKGINFVGNIVLDLAQ